MALTCLRDFFEKVDFEQRSQLNALAFLLENHRPDGWDEDSEDLGGVASIIKGITGEIERLRDLVHKRDWGAKVDVDWSKPDPIGQAERSLKASKGNAGDK